MIKILDRTELSLQTKDFPEGDSIPGSGLEPLILGDPQTAISEVLSLREDRELMASLGKIRFVNVTDVGVLQQQQAFRTSRNQHISVALLNRELPNADTTKNNAVVARNLDKTLSLMDKEKTDEISF
ncbi:hypothetical protein [Vacuolonema iberomarrocanum]|uniref:hypothetical protein n=1 Tax=Vacuolonema iberomarrocanum TaxID=3454632 RepID=UPI0019DF7FA0|nr:hypothetical protein [filamentous cyanobacterium LEGE 07170]